MYDQRWYPYAPWTFKRDTPYWHFFDYRRSLDTTFNPHGSFGTQYHGGHLIGSMGNNQHRLPFLRMFPTPAIALLRLPYIRTWCLSFYEACNCIATVILVGFCIHLFWRYGSWVGFPTFWPLNVLIFLFLFLFWRRGDYMRRAPKVVTTFWGQNYYALGWRLLYPKFVFCIVFDGRRPGDTKWTCKRFFFFFFLVLATQEMSSFGHACLLRFWNWRARCGIHVVTVWDCFWLRWHCNLRDHGKERY